MPRGDFRSFREEFDLVSLRFTLNALKWLEKKLHYIERRWLHVRFHHFNSKGRLSHFLSPYNLNHENHSTAEDWGFIWAIALWFLVKLELRFMTLNWILKWFSKIVEVFFEICLPFKSKIANGLRQPSSWNLPTAPSALVFSLHALWLLIITKQFTNTW